MIFIHKATRIKSNSKKKISKIILDPFNVYKIRSKIPKRDWKTAALE
jgi:hypothetical protein